MSKRPREPKAVRRDLRPHVQRWPRWWLCTVHLVVGVPVHLAFGLREGWRYWQAEWWLLRRLDEEDG